MQVRISCSYRSTCFAWMSANQARKYCCMVCKGGGKGVESLRLVGPRNKTELQQKNPEYYRFSHWLRKYWLLTSPNTVWNSARGGGTTSERYSYPPKVAPVAPKKGKMTSLEGVPPPWLCLQVGGLRRCVSGRDRESEKVSYREALYFVNMKLLKVFVNRWIMHIG